MMNTANSWKSSQDFQQRLGGEIIGNITRGCVIERLGMMRNQEKTAYNYRTADKQPPAFPRQTVLAVDETMPQLNSTWREKICHWSFNVIDHFDLSREVVAVSMSLFDRFLATRSNRCNGSTALLASLTTLHIAIKVHEVRKIKLSTLANLSRGQVRRYFKTESRNFVSDFLVPILLVRTEAYRGNGVGNTERFELACTSPDEHVIPVAFAASPACASQRFVEGGAVCSLKIYNGTFCLRFLVCGHRRIGCRVCGHPELARGSEVSADDLNFSEGSISSLHSHTCRTAPR